MVKNKRNGTKTDNNTESYREKNAQHIINMLYHPMLTLAIYFVREYPLIILKSWNSGTVCRDKLADFTLREIFSILIANTYYEC